MSALDSRITPARGDLAASHLRGLVDAKQFVDGETKMVSIGRASLRAGPSPTSGMTSEVLFGETVLVYERRDGWAWIQCALDGYVGYMREDVLGQSIAPTHRVSAISTPLLPAPDVKRPALDLLPMNANVQVTGHDGRFARVAPRGFVFSDHLVSLDAKEPDWVCIAQRFTGAPYIWGGKTYAGFDCSGLVQTALQAGGISSPRDSDMQEKALGDLVEDKARLRRGDLVFWNGHVAILLDEACLIHANASFMDVTIEPIAQAMARIAKAAGPITSVKRLKDCP